MTPEEKAKIERMLAWDNMDRDSGLYKAGWNEALEEAAAYFDDLDIRCQLSPLSVALSIRALKDAEK